MSAMGLQWFWQGLATNLLAALFTKWLGVLLLAAIAVGGVVFYLKKRNPSLASQILYGLAASCVVIVGFCAFTFMTVLKEIPQVNSSNVEEKSENGLTTFS
jgi:hypothetical protein